MSDSERGSSLVENDRSQDVISRFRRRLDEAFAERDPAESDRVLAEAPPAVREAVLRSVIQEAVAGSCPETAARVPDDLIRQFAAHGDLVRRLWMEAIGHQPVCDETFVPGHVAQTSMDNRPVADAASPGSDSAVASTQLASNRHAVARWADDEVPASIGRYHVERLLGRGAFGSVLLARDDDLTRRVAIKIPRADRFRSVDQIERFLNEARIVARLDHPGIVPVYDFGRHGERTPFVVMKYVPGRSLDEWLQGRGPLPAREAVELMVAIADAVGFAHRHGVIHRDLKPANILMDETGRPHVTDFGLAVDEDDQRHRAGEIAGTFAWMAPEQVRGEVHRLDGRADLWALGVILYQLLSGRLPFRGDSYGQISDEILHREPRPLRQLDPAIPAALDNIVTRSCAKRPADRYASTADLTADLAAWRDAAGSPTAAVAERSVSGLSVGRLLGGAVTVVLLTALALALVPGSRQPGRTAVNAPALAQGAPSESRVLRGSVDILVWDPDDAQRRGISLYEPGAHPLRPGDQVRVECRLSRKAYPYLIWIDSSGQALPLFPWTPGDWESRPTSEQPVDRISLPDRSDEGWAIEGQPGMETLMLFLRDVPLDAAGAAALRTTLEQLPPQPAHHAGALVTFENGRVVRVRQEQLRGPNVVDPRKLDDPVLETQRVLTEQLGDDFLWSCGISFSNQATP